MPIAISWLTQAQASYFNIKNYSDIRDPPHRRQEARLKLSDLLEDATIFVNEPYVSKYSPAKLISILVNCQLGVLYQENDELAVAEAYLNQAKSLLNEWYPNDPLLILLRLETYNQLAYVYSEKPDYEMSISILNQALEFYEKWYEFNESIVTQESDKDQPARTLIEMNDCFAYKLEDKFPSPNADIEPEKYAIKTLYYLAQIYQKTGDQELSSKYCYKTLRKQFTAGQFLDIDDWSINVAVLAQYFAEVNRFAVASHLLKAAQLALIMREEDVDDFDGEEAIEKEKADFNRIMIKYYLMLLSYSVSDGEEKLEEDISAVEEFRMMQDDFLAKKPINKITHCLVKDYHQAISIFKDVQQFAGQAKTFYALEEFCSDYVSIVQDESKLYRLVATFAKDPNTKCKFYKRRVNLLEGIIKEINPEPFVNKCREIHFELGETYYEMYEFKESMEREHSNSIVKKMNDLLKKSGENFEAFIDSFLDKTKDEIIPAKLPNELAKPLITAYFAVGRSHYKLICPDKTSTINNWKKCLNYYDRALQYAQANSDQQELVSKEMDLISEMIDIIPERIAQLSATRDQS